MTKKIINGWFFSGVTFGYEGQKPLFKNLDFGIDMDSRSELVALGGSDVEHESEGLSYSSDHWSPPSSLYCGSQWCGEEHTTPAADWQADTGES